MFGLHLSSSLDASSECWLKILTVWLWLVISQTVLGSTGIHRTSKTFRCQTWTPLEWMGAKYVKLKMPSFWANKQGGVKIAWGKLGTGLGNMYQWKKNVTKIQMRTRAVIFLAPTFTKEKKVLNCKQMTSPFHFFSITEKMSHRPQRFPKIHCRPLRDPLSLVWIFLWGPHAFLFSPP